MQIKRIFILVSVFMLMFALTSHAETKGASAKYGQRLSAVIEVMARQLDLSDYGDLFAGSGFNFKSNYASNRCNIRDRFKVQKQKDQLLDRIIRNVRRMDDKTIKKQLELYLIYDIEIKFLRNLDILETYPVGHTHFDWLRAKMWLKIISEFEKDMMQFPDINYLEIFNGLMKKYEPVLDQIIKVNGKKVKQKGVYSACGGSYQKILDDWSNISAKIVKSNRSSVGDFNIALAAFIKQLGSTREEFTKNWNKITKEELSFIEKNKGSGGAFDKFLNLTYAAGKTVVKDFIELGKAFESESNSLSKNTTVSSPQKLKEFMIEQLKKDPTKQALTKAVEEELRLDEISTSLSNLTSQARLESQKKIQLKKLELFYRAQQAYTNSVIDNSYLSVLTSKQATAQLKPDGRKPIDTLAKTVDNKQCNASL